MKREYWDDLLIFFTVAQLGNINEASQELGISTATISRRLDSLEGRLGKKLLLRDNRGCKPTKLGEKVIPIVGTMQLASETILSEVGLRKKKGVITIIGNDCHVYLIMKRLSIFKKESPLSSIKLITNTFSGNVENYKILLSSEKIEGEMIFSDKVGTVEYGYYANEDYFNQNIEAIHTRQWSNLDFITLDERSEDAAWYNKSIKSLTNNDFISKLQCDYSLSIYDAVVSGLGIGIVERSLAENTPSLISVFNNPYIHHDVWASIDKRIENHEALKLRYFLRDTFKFNCRS